MNAHEPPTDLSLRIAAAIRGRRDLLGADVSAALCSRMSGDHTTWQRTAARLVDLIAITIQSGDFESAPGALRDLQELAPGRITIPALFSSVHTCERMILDELTLHDELGAASNAWPAVAHAVRTASFSLLAVFATRLRQQAPACVLDPLTTLVVRPTFEMALQKEVTRARRHRYPLAVLLLDIAEFSDICRRHGHGVGDLLLERSGILVRRFFRQDDWVARYQPHTIAALLSRTPLPQAAALAERVRSTLEGRLVLTDYRTDARERVRLHAVAVGLSPVESLPPSQLLRAADAALERVKESGSRRVEIRDVQASSVNMLGAAALLDCAPGLVRRLVREGRLPAVRPGRHYEIDRASIERYRRLQNGARYPASS